METDELRQIIRDVQDDMEGELEKKTSITQEQRDWYRLGMLDAIIKIGRAYADRA